MSISLGRGRLISVGCHWGSLPIRAKEPQLCGHLLPPLCILEDPWGALAQEASRLPAPGTVTSRFLRLSGPGSYPSVLGARVPEPASADCRNQAVQVRVHPRARRRACAAIFREEGEREARPRDADPPLPPGPPSSARRALAQARRPRLPTSPRPRSAASRSPRPARRRAMGPARCLALGGLLALAGLLEGRLVSEQEAGFGECDRFFYAGTPPAGLAAAAHVKICQRSEGAERFATLYSTWDRIPVYSAFRAARPAPLGAEQRWLVEPQVSEALPKPDRWAGLPGHFADTVSGRAGKGSPSLRCQRRETRVSTRPTAPPELQTASSPVKATARAGRSASLRLSLRGPRPPVGGGSLCTSEETSAVSHSLPE